MENNQKKRKKDSIITVVDDNTVNKSAFIIMYTSFCKYSKSKDVDFWLLISLDLNDTNFLKFLKGNKIRFLRYKAEKNGDPYYAKFIIKRFISDKGNIYKNVLYLDPDHIFIKKFELEDSVTNTIYFSSECTIVDNDFLCTLSGLNSFINYNASFVKAEVDVWKKIVKDWESYYYLIQGKVSPRFQEEIAFTLSTLKNKINVKQIEVEIQSNFCCFNRTCQVFHYGGDYIESIQIKKYIGKMLSELLNGDILDFNLTESKEGEWCIKEILNVLK